MRILQAAYIAIALWTGFTISIPCKDYHLYEEYRDQAKECGGSLSKSYDQGFSGAKHILWGFVWPAYWTIETYLKYGENQEVKTAENGDIDAQEIVGKRFYYGRRTPRDYEKAFMWLKRSADGGNAPAQVLVGYMYDKKEGVPQDFAKAAEYYRRAADQGSSIGRRNLGIFYANGLGVERDLSESYFWFQLAADQDEGGLQSDLDRWRAGFSEDELSAVLKRISDVQSAGPRAN